MGNWGRNRRRNYYNYESSRPCQSGPPPKPPPHPDLWQNSVPSWEKKFCTSAGIPWRRVVDAKKFMYYHDGVLNWNDSAGEEAFHNAKRRFWAKMNGFPCDISPPDPDIYIDEIDWNPNIDPELILNLDQEFFAPPDEREKNFKLDTNQNSKHPLSGDTAEGYDVNPGSRDNPWELNMNKNLKDITCTWNKWGGCTSESRNLDRTNSKVFDHAAEGHDGNPDASDSPWKSCNMQGALKDKALIRSQWGQNINKSTNLNDGVHWKHSCSWEQGDVRDNAWGNCEDNSLGTWNLGRKNINQSRNLGNDVDNWEHSCNQAEEIQRNDACGGWNQGWSHHIKPRTMDNAYDPWACDFHGAESVGFKEGWDSGNNPWDGNHWENNINKQKKLSNGYHPWKHTQGNEAGNDGIDSGDKSWGCKQWENNDNNNNKGRKTLESWKGSGGWGVWSGGCRKREGSCQYMSSYKSSRIHGDSYQTDDWGRKGRARKRVNFSMK